MKPYKILLLVGLFIFAVSANVNAFDPATDCLKTLTKINAGYKLQTVFGNYTDTTKFSKKLEDGTYTLCFEPNTQFCDPTKLQCNVIATITASPSAPLLIYGLNLSASNLGTQALLTLSGSNITLFNSTLTGTGTGTAIQVNGTNNKIESSTISNFAQGVNVASDATANLNKNIYKAVGNETAMSDAVFDPSIISPVDEWLIGKKVSENDQTKAESVAGKVNLGNCTGGVEMYYGTNIVDYKVSAELRYHPSAVCTLSTVQDKDIKLKFADDAEETIKTGSCVFVCNGFSENLTTQIAFAYSDANGRTYPFVPLPIQKLSDLADVINVPGLPIYAPTTSGMTVEEPASFDPDNPKTETIPINNNGSGDGAEQVNQGSGSGSCGANILAAQPFMGGLIAQLALVFGSLPILISKRKK